jgi:hypothetical protein
MQLPSSKFFDALRTFSTTIVGVAPTNYAVANNVVSVTAAAHGLGALFTAFANAGAKPDQGIGPLLGVVFDTITTPATMNSSWIIDGITDANTYTFKVTPTQAALFTGAASMAGAHGIPFVVLTPGLWEVMLGANGVLRGSFTDGDLPGGANAASGGSVIPFVGTFGGGTYNSLATGAAAAVSRMVNTDGKAFFILFSGGAGTTKFAKYA